MLTATSGTGATVSKLYLGEDEVKKGSGGANWSVSDGTITLKKAYLATLEEGENVFTFTFTKDNDVEVKITVEDSTE